MTITIDDNGDGTWTVHQSGQPAATIVAVPTGTRVGSLSIDVKPLHPSMVQAIVFGAEPIAPEGGRQDRLRYDTDKPDGRLREGAMPFVCADLQPKG